MLTLVRNVSNVLMACYEIDCCCFSFNYYLFSFACAGSSWLCTSALVVASGGCPPVALLLVWRLAMERGLQELWLLGSRVVVAHGLSCSAA